MDVSSGAAVDHVRRAGSRERPELKHSGYLWLKNEGRLSDAQSATLLALTRMHLKTARACRLRLAFQEIYSGRSHDWGGLILDREASSTSVMAFCDGSIPKLPPA
jgi:hypothetical protein